MKPKVTFSILAWVFVVCSHCLGAEWSTDFHEASKVALVAGKPMLLYFTGSDWSGDCMKLENEIFNNSTFDFYAMRHLILVKVDFPHRKIISDDERAQNRELMRRLGVQGYPTIVVLRSSGQDIGRTGYVKGGTEAFIKELESMPGYFDSKPNGRALEPDPPPFQKRDPPFIPIPPQVPIYYENLALKGISGPAKNRVALINNENFFVGDTAKVKLKDTKVKVTCKEIRQDSVLLEVEGKTVELKLAHKD